MVVWFWTQVNFRWCPSCFKKWRSLWKVVKSYSKIIIFLYKCKFLPHSISVFFNLLRFKAPLTTKKIFCGTLTNMPKMTIWVFLSNKALIKRQLWCAIILYSNIWQNPWYMVPLYDTLVGNHCSILYLEGQTNICCP